jgi:hypothetical protein
MKSIFETWKSKVTSVIIEDDYINEYYKFGDLRRLDKNNKRHSLYSPAVICNNGSKFWYYHGKLHRLNGPAIECDNGSKSWYIYDEFIGNSINSYTQEKFEQYKIDNHIV